MNKIFRRDLFLIVSCILITISGCAVPGPNVSSPQANVDPAQTEEGTSWRDGISKAANILIVWPGCQGLLSRQAVTA